MDWGMGEHLEGGRESKAAGLWWVRLGWMVRGEPEVPQGAGLGREGVWLRVPLFQWVGHLGDHLSQGTGS